MVTSADIAVELGRTLASAEATQAEQWIADAHLLIAARLGDPALLDQSRLDYVVRNAVAERMRNPEGFVSETIDDYTYRRAAAGSSGVWISEEWWDLLAPAIESSAFSTRPTFEADTTTSTTTWF